MKTDGSRWLLSLAVIVVCLLSTTIGFADNGDDTENENPDASQSEDVKDNPAWENYAFDLPYADNTGRLSFHDLARSDEPFVIFWWLTNCPMCHLQMPYVEHLQNQISEYELDLMIVSICIDSNKQDCLSLIKDKEISFPVLIDERARRTKLNYKIPELGTPLAYVFGAGGEQVDTICGFRSSFGEDILAMLEIELPATQDETP